MNNSHKHKAKNGDERGAYAEPTIHCHRDGYQQKHAPCARAIHHSECRTVQYCRAVLRKGLNQALRDALVARNAAALADPPRCRTWRSRRTRRSRFARSWRRLIKGNRQEALFTVAVALGLRQGEILGLRWKDVDLCTGFLSVGAKLQRIDGKPCLVEPKTKKSRMTIKLPQWQCLCSTSTRKGRLRRRGLQGGDGRNGAWCLPQESERQLIPATSIIAFKGWRHWRDFRRYAFMVSGTRPQLCYSPKGSSPGSSWRFSATPPSA